MIELGNWRLLSPKSRLSHYVPPSFINSGLPYVWKHEVSHQAEENKAICSWKNKAIWCQWARSRSRVEVKLMPWEGTLRENDQFEDVLNLRPKNWSKYCPGSRFKNLAEQFWKELSHYRKKGLARGPDRKKRLRSGSRDRLLKAQDKVISDMCKNI